MKKFASFALALLLCAALCVTAAASEAVPGRTDWYCYFTADAGMDSNFDLDALGMSDELSGLQPGDSAKFHIKLENQYAGATDWYMTNEVLESLEATRNAASGGAYSYDLRYVGPSGVEDVLFTSDSVGGEGKTLADREGLNEATSALEDFFFLDTLGSGQSGDITLIVSLEGETQGNAYQDTLANLQMNFAVELSQRTPDTPGPSATPEASPNPDETPNPDATPTPVAPTPTPTEKPPFTPVRTGDETNLLLWSGVTLACGLGLLVAAFVLRHYRKKRKDNEDE